MHVLLKRISLASLGIGRAAVDSCALIQLVAQ